MPNQESNLARAIGRWSLAALMVNIIIGGGIFELPSIVAGILGAQSPIAPLVAAAGVGVIAACIAEVGSRFQHSGGPYLYARVAFGRFFGLQTGWLLWLTRISSAAAVANVFLDYLEGLWEQARVPAMRLVVLTILIGGFAAINIRGVKFGTWASNFFMIMKLLPLLLLGVGGLAFIHFHGSPVQLATESHPASAWMNAVLLFVFAYSGFEAALIPAGELKNPARDAPVALLVALVTVTAVYLMVQVVVTHVLANPGQTVVPLSAAANVFGGRSMSTIVSLGALLSSTGFLAANMIATPRITFAFAEQSDFPRWLSAIHHRFQTPYNSIATYAALVWLLALMGTFRWNAVLAVTSRLFIYGIACAALPMLRKKFPGREGFRLPGGPILAAIGVVFALILASCMGVAELIALATTAVVSLVNWFVIRSNRTLPGR